MAPRDLLIVVADDDAAIREALASALEEEGHSVTVAGDGQEALARIADGPPPCAILLDWNMPRLGGAEFLDERDASPRLRPVPVFVISAAERARQDPRITGYLQKPFTLGALLEVIHSVCDAHCGKPSCDRRPTR
jgi:CheY-like chemotaxis protein